MAAPRLQLRKGTTAPSGSIALIAEPFFDTTNKNLYVADGASSFVHIGGASFTSRVSAFLTSATSGASATVAIASNTTSGGSITLTAPATASTQTYTLPTSPTNGYILSTDGSGVLSWVAQTSGFSNWVLSDGTNTQTVNSTDTVTISGGSGISSLVSATDTVTLSLDINELTALDGEAGPDALLVADSIPVYDASAAGNKKVSIANLETVIFSDISGDISVATNGTASIGAGVIVNADINASAAIAVSKLANGTTRQLLQTNAAGTGVEWTSNIDVPGTLDVTGAVTFDSNLTVSGNLTVNGTVTTISTTNTTIADRLIELANGTTGTPTADSGIVIERGDSSNVFIGYDEGVDLFVVGTTAITGSGTDAAPVPITFLAGALNLTDTVGTNEAVVSYLALNGLYTGSAAGRYLQNVIVDFGTY